METPGIYQHNPPLVAHPDPSWDYHAVWVNVIEGMKTLTDAIAYMNQQEMACADADAELVDRLTKALVLLEMARGLLVHQPPELQQDEYTRRHLEN